jgi:hypothetical protein
MAPGAVIAANGTAALSAAQGITVGKISSDKRIDLFSPAGQIVAAGPVVGAHAQAPAVSFYGYGQSWGAVQADRLLLVQADQALQVSAPTGVAARNMTDQGTVYRLMDRGAGQVLLRLAGDAPERVMVASGQVQSAYDRLSAQGQAPALAWPSTVGTGSAAFVARTPSAAPAAGFTAVERYLQSQPAPLLAMRLLSVPASQDLLEDMAYGLAPQEESASMSLELDAPLLRSTGQLLTENDWSLEPQ